MSFIRKRKHVQFKPEILEESTMYLQNPSCGWYHIYPFAIEEKQDFEELYWCLHAEERIVLALIDIGAFRGEELSGEALCNLSDILEFFEKHDREIILRITYDRDGRGMEHEPDFLQTVIGHMRQLGAVICAHREQILVVQGMLVGSWGEMHDSKFLSEERLRQLMQVWRKALGDIPLAVRTPQQWRLLHSEKKAGCCEKTGLFNDGMFGSMDDLGTYGCQSRAKSGWGGKWCREEELDFIGTFASHVPYGGEAVAGSLELSFQELVREMRCTKACYLNCVHDEKRLQQWRDTRCGEPGVWEQKSIFDYIGCHLGYRFVVRDVKLEKKKQVSLKICIENTGFCALREDVEFVVSLADQRCCILLEQSCSIQPQEREEITAVLPERMAAATGDVLLEMRRKRDRHPLYFANTPSEAGRIRLGTYWL